MSLHDIWRGDVMPLSGIAVSIGRNSFDPPAPVVPVFDIHARSFVLHDSGSNASGILTYNSRTAIEGGRLELIPSTSGAQPIVTAILFNAYNTTNNSVTTSLTVLTLNTERTNTHPEIFVFSNNEIQINQDGTYAIEYSSSFDIDFNTRTSARTYLERQPAGGVFAEVAGSRSFTYHRLAAQGEGTGTCKIIISINRGDAVRLRSIVLSGANIVQIPNSTSITIRKLD